MNKFNLMFLLLSQILFHSCSSIHNLSMADDKTNQAKNSELNAKKCSFENRLECDQSSNVKNANDSQKSKEKLSNECRQNIEKSCLSIGLLLISEGLDDEAKNYFRLACDNESAAGCFNVGVIESKANENKEEAKRYYRLACQYKNSSGCFNIATLALKERYLNEARIFFRRACSHHHGDGCAHYGLLKREQSKNEDAQFYFSLACQYNSALGCFHLGIIERDAGNIVKAKSFFKKSCNLDQKLNLGCSQH